MKYSSKILMVAAALVAATLCVSSTAARKAWGTAAEDSRVFFRLSDEPKPAGFEAQVRGGEVVGMTVVKQDGARASLKQQAKPTCATSCPSGQKLTCWEDEAQMMSVCVCGTGGGGASGTPGRASVIITAASGQ
jgi:hypothetical protein